MVLSCASFATTVRWRILWWYWYVGQFVSTCRWDLFQRHCDSIMYFRFCGWRHVFIQWAYGSSHVSLSGESQTAPHYCINFKENFSSMIKIVKYILCVAQRERSVLFTIPFVAFVLAVHVYITNQARSGFIAGNYGDRVWEGPPNINMMQFQLAASAVLDAYWPKVVGVKVSRSSVMAAAAARDNSYWSMMYVSAARRVWVIQASTLNVLREKFGFRIGFRLKLKPNSLSLLFLC